MSRPPTSTGASARSRIGAANQRGWREDWAADRLFADFAADLVALSGGPG